MAKHVQEYDWLNDPFDEKKAAEEKKNMSGGSKAAVGIGCLVAVVLLVALAVVGVMLLISPVGGV